MKWFLWYLLVWKWFLAQGCQLVACHPQFGRRQYQPFLDSDWMPHLQMNAFLIALPLWVTILQRCLVPVSAAGSCTPW